MVRGRGQSTKEFARSVVEAEFKKKRKSHKRKHEGYSSDSSGNGDDEDDKKPKKKGHPNLLRPAQVKGSTKEPKEVTQEYRDRAKERREGGVSSEPSAMAIDPDLPLPLVQNGLDMTLVRQERGKLLKQKDNNLSKASDHHEHLDLNVLPTLDQDQITMSQFLNESNTLSPEISSYIMDLLDFSKTISKKKVVCGLEGKIVQRTMLVMNALGHPSDRRRAWEVPREIVHATTQEEYHATPPLSEEKLQAIDRAFPTKQARHDSATSVEELEQSQPKAETRKEIDSGAESEENDDIFDGLDDYVPPKRVTQSTIIKLRPGSWQQPS